MDRNKILSTIFDLGYSQGFYGRLYRDLVNLKNNDEDTYEEIMTNLEAQNFSSAVDLVLFLEC